MAGVEFYKINDQSLILTTAAQTVTFGENIPSGRTVESVIIHIEQTGVGMVAGSLDNIIANYRSILNGVVYIDFRTSITDPANTGLGRFGYMLQSMGNNAVSTEVPSDTSKSYWAEIPMGAIPATGVGRMEFVMGFAGMTTSATAGKMEVWLRLNDATTSATFVVPQTSFTAATGIQSVVVRVPQNVQGVVSGLLIQNQSEAADNISTQGIRAHLLGAFGLAPSLLRYLNSDLTNGLQYAEDGVSTTEQQYAIGVPGSIFLPLFGAVGGDIQLEVDFSNDADGQSYTFQPIMVAALGGKNSDGVKSTQSLSSNTSKSILARTNQ